MALLFQHFFITLSGVFPVIFTLNSNDSEFAIYHLVYLYDITINFPMFLNNYYCVLSNYT